MNLMKALVGGVFLLFLADMRVGAVAGGHTDSKKHAPGKEFDFRGAVLAMPLADFREMSFPDLSIEPKAKLFCSSDEETKDLKNGFFFFLGDGEKAAGVTECKYYVPRGEAVGFDMGWEEAMSSVGTHGVSKSTTYDFVLDPRDKIARLYSIVVLAYANSAPSAMEGLRQKFGEPSAITRGTVQNRMGAAFDHTLATWMNPVSMIVFDNPSGDVDSMAISYTELRLSAYVEHVKRKIEGPSSSKM